MKMTTAVKVKQINVSEFKAVCLRLLEDVRQTGQPIEILKNGKPLAVVYPPPVANRKAAFGSLRLTLAAPVGDLISPLDESEWEALRD
jgi:prevent-host-death family protein